MPNTFALFIKELVELIYDVQNFFECRLDVARALFSLSSADGPVFVGPLPCATPIAKTYQKASKGPATRQQQQQQQQQCLELQQQLHLLN